MSRDDNTSTDGTRIFKTRNGGGKLLVDNHVIRVLWDNKDEHVAYMPDPDTIAVVHGNTVYNFTHVNLVPEGSKWNYAPWGGVCIAKWVDGELWLGRDTIINTNTNGTLIFKTKGGAGKLLVCMNRVVNILWDNTDQHLAFMPNDKSISVLHGDTVYHFTKV